MGNKGSKAVDDIPAYSRYQTSTVPDSFFDESARQATLAHRSEYAINYTDRCTFFSNNAIIRCKVLKTPSATNVNLRGSDGSDFRLNLGDIQVHASALIPENWSPGRTVYLREKSTVLGVLFQFIGPRKHPNLLKKDFEFVAELARAAEKYSVFSALNLCSERMR